MREGEGELLCFCLFNWRNLGETKILTLFSSEWTVREFVHCNLLGALLGTGYTTPGMT